MPWMPALLDTYVSTAGPGENRAEARKRIEAALEQGADATLDLSNLGLRYLPAVLPAVVKLNVSGNRLTHLTVLPCELEELDASNNQLRALPPVLPNRLRELRVSDNALSGLPSFPSSLAYVDASRNALRDLPNASFALMTLRVDGNRGVDLTERVKELLYDARRRRIIVEPNAAGQLKSLGDEFTRSSRCQPVEKIKTDLYRAWRQQTRTAPVFVTGTAEDTGR